MKKLIYIEENFISLDECQRFIDLSLANKEEKVNSNSNSEDTYSTTVEWGNHGASYYGGDVDPTVPSLNDEVITRVNSICKNFDSDANLDYVGVVRWPIGTFYENLMWMITMCIIQICLLQCYI